MRNDHDECRIKIGDKITISFVRNNVNEKTYLLNGKAAVVVKCITEVDEAHDFECLPMYKVQTVDKKIIELWEDEFTLME